MWDPPQVHCILTILASDFFSIFPSHLKERPFQRSLGSAQPIESWNFLRLPLIPSIRKIHGRKNFNPVKNRKRRLDPRDQRTTVRFGLVGWRLVGIPYGLKRRLGPQLKFEIYSNRLGYVCGKTHPTLANAAKNPSPNLRLKFYQLIPSPQLSCCSARRTGFRTSGKQPSGHLFGLSATVSSRNGCMGNACLVASRSLLLGRHTWCRSLRGRSMWNAGSASGDCIRRGRLDTRNGGLNRQQKQWRCEMWFFSSWRAS